MKNSMDFPISMHVLPPRTFSDVKLRLTCLENRNTWGLGWSWEMSMVDEGESRESLVEAPVNHSEIFRIFWDIPEYSGILAGLVP